MSLGCNIALTSRSYPFYKQRIHFDISNIKNQGRNDKTVLTRTTQKRCLHRGKPIATGP